MRIAVSLLAWSCIVASGQQKFFAERIGDLGVKRDPATWSSPESVVHDLRSKDAAVRLKAMRLVGVNEDFFGTGDTPAEIDLRYTTFGFDDQTAAVITVEQSSFQYAAVAVPMTGGWKRLAVFECWCKYEAPLDDFVHVAPVVSGQSLELQIMVRASGGGTGLYEQTEAWFRPRRGILEPVISFTRRRSQSPYKWDAVNFKYTPSGPAHPCKYEPPK